MWYFVCERCNAKWFASREGSSCPRCGHDAVSNEQHEVPWLTRKYAAQAEESK